MTQKDLIQKILKYSPKDKLALFIRHADRDKIPTGSFGNEVLINEKGIQNSIEFGEDLSGLKINKIFSSPIPRCVETGNYISKGYGKNIPIETSTALGNPGLHISDDQEAGKFYLEYGLDELYQYFINNQDIPGVTSATEYKKLMTDFLVDNTKKGGITIFITHDILVAFYHFALSGKTFTKDNWIAFLTGVIIKK